MNNNETDESRQAGDASVTELVADDGDDGDQFGRSVAIAGNTAFVGAPRDEDPNGTDGGSAYVFGRSGETWNQQAKLAASGNQANDRFGRAVTLSRNGQTALVGAPGTRNGNQTGSVSVFERSGGEWSQQTTLTISDGAQRDFFGFAVALAPDGATAVVGAPGDDPTGKQAGSAYVFTRSGGEWSQRSQLTAPDGDSSDQFGNAVAIADTSRTALVGARNDEDPHGTTGSPFGGAGSAYVFERFDGGWEQPTKLIAPDGDEGDFFGNAVAISGDGRTAVVGARLDEDPNGSGSGSSYVFTRSEDGGWSRRAKLVADDGDQGDDFGRDVTVAGNRALVGARNDEDPNGPGAGSAYVFAESGGEWEQRVKLSAPDGEPVDRFGIVIAVDRSSKFGLVGAPGNRKGTQTGAAYLFSL